MGVKALGFGLILALAGSAAASPRTYVGAAACAGKAGRTSQQCERALREARIAFDASAPHFASRAACEQRFQRCQIGHVFAHGGADFTPAMRGFQFIGERAAPVTERALPQPTRAVARVATESEAPRGDLAPYPVPKAMLDDMRERERRYAGKPQ